jgi:hypothetical protein
VVLGDQTPNAALLDYLLPDGNGVELGVLLQRKSPGVQVIIMTGAQLTPEEEAICQEYDFPDPAEALPGERRSEPHPGAAVPFFGGLCDLARLSPLAYGFSHWPVRPDRKMASITARLHSESSSGVGTSVPS